VHWRLVPVGGRVESDSLPLLSAAEGVTAFLMRSILLSQKWRYGIKTCSIACSILMTLLTSSTLWMVYLKPMFSSNCPHL
jgi:hypothetical protein